MMSLISEADLSRGVSESLDAPLRSVLDNLFKKDVSPELIGQIASDFLRLARELELSNQSAQVDASSSTQRKLFLSFGQRILALFDRYSEFLGEDGQKQAEKAREVLEATDFLMQGVQQIGDSEEKDGIELLSELYEGLDKIVTTVETRGNLLSTSLQSVLKLLFDRLPAYIEEKLNAAHLDERQEETNTIEQFRRMLARTVMSGRFYLGFWAEKKQNSSELTEEEILKKQIESNQVPLQAIRFLIQEDHKRVLTSEHKKDNKLLMEIIDEHRERKLFV